MTPADRALELIAFTLSPDFEDHLAWAQWCRDVARAARRGDAEAIERLAAEWKLGRDKFDRSVVTRERVGECKMRAPVWVEIPDDYELACDYMRFPKVGESVLSGSGSIHEVHPHDGQAMCMLRVIVRPAWVWPDWLLAPLVAMDQDGDWFAYETEPYIKGGLWLTDGIAVALENELLAFTPPPCTDWRASLRRNPHLKEAT